MKYLRNSKPRSSVKVENESDVTEDPPAKDATVEFRDIWSTTIPKVFEIARNETSNLSLQSLHKDTENDPSCGEQSWGRNSDLLFMYNLFHRFYIHIGLFDDNISFTGYKDEGRSKSYYDLFASKYRGLRPVSDVVCGVLLWSVG